VLLAMRRSVSQADLRMIGVSKIRAVAAHSQVQDGHM
jgi:hypothetical protein